MRPVDRPGGRARAVVVLLVLVATACGSARAGSGASPSASVQYGTPAPGFSLVDQFGRVERLSDFRGTVVLLTFVDARCTTVCPLTADVLRRAKESLGGEPPVRLVAIDANPEATSVADVRRWSARQGMLHGWLFLTASTKRLRHVWASYGVQVRVRHDEVEHSAAIFLIDASGRERGIVPVATRSGIPSEADALAQAVRRIA